MDDDKKLHISALVLFIKTADKFTFRASLEGFFMVMPELSTSDVLKSTIFLLIKAVGYSLETRNAEMLDLVNILVAKLEKEEEFTSKLIVSLIRKMTNLSETGFPAKEILHTNEFICIVTEFSKIATSLGKTTLFDEFEISLLGKTDKESRGSCKPHSDN